MGGAAPSGKEEAGGVLSGMGGCACDDNGTTATASVRALGLLFVTRGSSVDALAVIVCECRRKSLICWSYIGVVVGGS